MYSPSPVMDRAATIDGIGSPETTAFGARGRIGSTCPAADQAGTKRPRHHGEGDGAGVAPPRAGWRKPSLAQSMAVPVVLPGNRREYVQQHSVNRLELGCILATSAGETNEQKHNRVAFGPDGTRTLSLPGRAPEGVVIRRRRNSAPA